MPKTEPKKSKLADNKTKQNEASVEDFINSVESEQKRKDSFAILEMMKKASGEEPKMWGGSIIGFGYVIIKSPTSGREVEWFRVGFSPRKANLTVYLTGLKRFSDLLEKLGKHKTGGGCLYLNKLGDVDLKVLGELIDKSYKADYFGD
jgi:hypothetical protein